MTHEHRDAVTDGRRVGDDAPGEADAPGRDDAPGERPVEDGAERGTKGGDERTGAQGRLDTAWSSLERRWDGRVAAVAASRVGRWFKRTDRPGMVDWALLVAISALAFVTFLYGDIRATFEHSFNFLDALFDGRPQDFYQVGIDNNTFGHPAVYDVPIYIVFAIWNLPTYLVHQFGEFDYLTSLPALLWLKTMLVAFTLASTWLMMKIARELGLSTARAKWVAFYFLSSMTLFVPVLIVVQYDIIPITFMLAGVLAYMRGRIGSFLGWFLVANTLKLFAVFIFIPLILLREKRLPRAIAQIVVGLLGLVLCRLPYVGDLGYQISTGGFTEGMLVRLASIGVEWGNGLSVPLFVAFMVGLAVFAYVKRVTGERELHAFAVYLPLAAFLVFCAFVPLNPYWAALVAPFAVLIIFANPRHLTVNSLLELSIGSAIFVIYTMVGYSMYNSVLFRYLLTGRIVPPAEDQRYDTPGEILLDLGMEDKVVYLVGFLVACVLAVLVLNYPRAQFVAGMPNTQPIQRSVVWVRLAAPAAFCALLFAMYLLPHPPVAYSTVTDTPTLTEANLLAVGTVVEEELEFDETLVVDTVQVGLDADAVTWINTAAVQLSILDSSGDVVLERSTAANAVKVGLTQFEADGLVLDAGETYTLRLTADEGRPGEPLFVQVNPSVDEFDTTQDGSTVDGDLVLVLNGTPKA